MIQSNSENVENSKITIPVAEDGIESIDEIKQVSSNDIKPQVKVIQNSTNNINKITRISNKGSFNFRNNDNNPKYDENNISVKEPTSPMNTVSTLTKLLRKEPIKVITIGRPQGLNVLKSPNNSNYKIIVKSSPSLYNIDGSKPPITNNTNSSPFTNPKVPSHINLDYQATSSSIDMKKYYLNKDGLQFFNNKINNNEHVVNNIGGPIRLNTQGLKAGMTLEAIFQNKRKLLMNNVDLGTSSDVEMSTGQNFKIGNMSPGPKVVKKSRNDKTACRGLRHFSRKVCEKVQQKGSTTYNEVADELIEELSKTAGYKSDADYEHKNIRRRVYDALNVLMAMNIITKEKKEIKWVGLPTSTVQECSNLENERKSRFEGIVRRRDKLREMIVQYVTFKNLIERNKAVEENNGIKPPNNTTVSLPFIVLSTEKSTTIDCSISNDKSEYIFTFDKSFQVHDDVQVLRKMGLSKEFEECVEENEEIKTIIDNMPSTLSKFIKDMSFNKVEDVLESDKNVNES